MKVIIIKHRAQKQLILSKLLEVAWLTQMLHAQQKLSNGNIVLEQCLTEGKFQNTT